MAPWLFGLLVARLIPSAEAAPLPGEKLPSIELASAGGQPRRAWKRGRVTVISFCAFWCDTWHEQSRRLDASQRALRGLPVDWTMISVDGRWSAKTRGDKGNNWSDITQNALLDLGSRWTHRLDVTSVPYTLVVDGTGEIVFATQGIARAEPLRAAARAALGIASPPGGTLHLAIDDFPSRDARLDDALLDVLRARGIKATFYGSKSRRQVSPAITQRAEREGHLLRLTFPVSQRNVIDPFDFKVVGEKELLRRITGSLQPGKTLRIRAGIHDTVQILPRLLSGAQARGLKIEP